MNTHPDHTAQPYPIRNPYAAEQKRQFRTACMLGIGLLLYIAGNSIISVFLASDPSFYDRYLHDGTFSIAVSMLHTAFDVFLPFFIVFLLLRKRGILTDLPLGRSYDSYNAVLLTFIGLGGCYLANTITSYLTIIASAFGIESFTMNAMSDLATQNPAPAVLQILGYAVFPALFEEFAYRGVVLQSLRRYGDWFAIFMSALLFGLLHGNIVQIPFAFMVGILLGWCTVVSGTMWVGIAIHFGNNLLSSLQTILQTACGEAAAYAATAAMMVCLFVLGIICFIIYKKHNKNIFRLRPSRYLYMKHSTARVLCAPTILLACIYFLYTMLMDIDGFYAWLLEGIGNLFSVSVIG